MKDKIKRDLQEVEAELIGIRLDLENGGDVLTAGMIEGARAVVLSVLGGRK